MDYSKVKNTALIIIIGLILLFLIAYDSNIFDSSNEYIYNNSLPINHNFNKTALVTGGARGIGEAYVNALLSNGYKVVIIDILNAEKKANELGKIYGTNNVVGIKCDVTNHVEYDVAFKKASGLANDGVLDIIILNAGIIDNLFHNATKVIETNLLAPIYGAELYIKQITNGLTEKSKKNCLIIITGSLASFVPIDISLSPVYDASKSGIGQFVRSCKPIAHRYNFRINSICPTTMVDTEMVKPALNTVAKQKMNDIYLNTGGRGGVMKPNDMTPALLHIISNTTLNGELIAVNSNLGFDVRVEPRDEFGAFAEYGEWDESNSSATKYSIDYILSNIHTKKIWSQ